MGESLPSPKGEVGVLRRPREAGRESGLCGLGYFMYLGILLSFWGSKLLERRNSPYHMVLSSA